MIIEIISKPDIPVFDEIREEIQDLVGLKLQASSPSFAVTISSTSRAAMNLSVEPIEHYYIWPNNLLDAVVEKNPELHQKLLRQIKRKHLERIFLVLNKTEVKKI